MTPRPSHQVLWFTAAGAAGVLILCFGGAGLAASPREWLGGLMIVAYIAAAAAVVLFICGVRELRFPLARLAAEPEFPILAGLPPDDDPRSEMRQALDASTGRRPLYEYCVTCGYPYGRRLASAACTAPAICAKRLATPVANRLRIGGPIGIDQRWLARHPETG